MKKIVNIYLLIPLWVRLIVVVTLIAWAMLTLSLFQKWRNIEHLITWINSQLSLGVLVGLSQVGISVALWYRIGFFQSMLEHYKITVKDNFDRVQKERITQDRQVSMLARKIATIEGSLETLKQILINKN